MRPKREPAVSISPTYRMPARPGSSMKRPASSPATRKDRLASSTMRWARRAPAGAAQSEAKPMTSATGRVTASSGRQSWRGPRPTEHSTAISLSP